MASCRAVVCEGPGYRLRPLHEDDAQQIANFSEDERYWRYLIDGPRTLQQVQSFVADAVSMTNDPDGRQTWWAVETPEGSTVIGTAHIKRLGALADRQGSAGCTLFPDVQGQGLGTRLGWDLIALAFEQFDFHRLELTCALDNTGSLHIMRDTYGLTYEGVRRDHTLTSRGWWSSHIFSILEDEYAARKDSKFPAR